MFDTLGSSRKAVNIARQPAAALVIGWDDDISVQIEGDARRPQGDDLAYAKAAYFREWPDGRARENWPDIAYIVVKPRWMRYANYAGAPVIEEFSPVARSAARPLPSAGPRLYPVAHRLRRLVSASELKEPR